MEEDDGVGVGSVPDIVSFSLTIDAKTRPFHVRILTKINNVRRDEQYNTCKVLQRSSCGSSIQANRLLNY